MDEKSIKGLIQQLQQVMPALKGRPRRKLARRVSSASTRPSEPKRCLVNRFCAKGEGGRDTSTYGNHPEVDMGPGVEL